MAKDPVCGMTVSEHSQFRHVHVDKTYLFCGKSCLSKFQAAPRQYLTPPSPAKVAETARDASSSGHSGSEYTCLMHPEVR